MELELSNRLSKIIAQKRRKVKLEADLHSVQKELKSTSARLASLKAQLDKEQVDVEKLERTNLTALFYSVLGNREQQLEKERQELLSAQLNYQQVLQQVAYLEYDQKYLSEQLAGLGDIESVYADLLAEKEDLLRLSNQVTASELIAYTEQIAQLDSQEKEITEAIAAGNNLLSGLDLVIDSLESASGWGTWDLLGGGLLSTAVKHSKLDAARTQIHSLQTYISRFSRELADVKDQVDIQINIGEFESFADHFFDNLIVDWVVQSKISDSLKQANLAKSNISQTVYELEGLKKSTQQQKSELQEKRVLILEQA